jgi:hypothetical protein
MVNGYLTRFAASAAGAEEARIRDDPAGPRSSRRFAQLVTSCLLTIRQSEDLSPGDGRFSSLTRLSAHKYGKFWDMVASVTNGLSATTSV